MAERTAEQTADPGLLAATLARLAGPVRSLAVGSDSPIPATAALLAAEWARRQGRRLTVSILGSPRHTPFTEGGRELFDFAAQGRLDAFVLGGGQIDGQGNVNLVGIGGYPRPQRRFPGNFGAPYLYSLVPAVILFRQEHSRRVLVPQVDFVSAAGSGPPGSHRPGGPRWLVTGRAVFRFDPAERRFVLASLHPGETLDGVVAATGFSFAVDPGLAETPPPDADDRALLRGPVAAELAHAYPRFAARHFSPATEIPR